MAAARGVGLKSTPALIDLLNKAAGDPAVPEELRSKAAAVAKEENISWKTLRPIYMAIRESKQEGNAPSLRNACKDSQLVLPSNPEKEKSPELVARLEKLQRQEEERIYTAMVHDVTSHERRAEALREGALVRYKDQLSYGLHITVVMGAFFGVGYLAASRVSQKTSVKAAGGLSGLVLAMLVESVLLIIRTSGVGRKTGKQRKPPRTGGGRSPEGPPATGEDVLSESPSAKKRK